jgi:hypothetical protein
MDENPEEKIKITYFTPMNDGKSSVIAVFGCYVVKQDLYFSQMKLLQKKDGGIFISPPSQKYTDPKTGKDTYSNFFWYGNRVAPIFQETCLASIKSYCLRKNINYYPLRQPSEDNSVFHEQVNVQDNEIPF